MARQTVTNAMRLLTQARVPFEPLYYDLGDEMFSGEAVRDALGAAGLNSFKTLCARGERSGVAVFVVPVAAELNLKLAAQALHDKAVSLIPVKDLLALTGYERGGVSPVGMKKRYTTVIDITARDMGAMCVSGGVKGVSLSLNPDDLARFLGAAFAPLV